MHKNSSRRRSQKDEKQKKKGEGSCSRSTASSHPATGIYSTDLFSDSAYTYSSSTYSKKVVEENGKRSETEEYDSMEEYEVDFPPVELKMPRHRRHNHHSKRRNEQAAIASKSLDRRGVYEELPSGSAHSNRTSSFYSPSIASQSSTYQSYNSQNRLQSIGNIFSSLIGFFQNNPNMTKFLLGVTLCYVVVCNLEILIPKVISMIVRLLYPWARYSAVVAEQFFSTIANVFTRMDAVIYATYCEFAAKYCRSRRLMCDVTCSFVDHVLSQSRPNLAPIPQN
ncbi:unnamed protein product [Caenorhabditis sp. 36 PRJEB53466]|nr:unnamed protein product [Caenorhabditis sp. 36 PRJEB53466]